jgi:hypothetical protein
MIKYKENRTTIYKGLTVARWRDCCEMGLQETVAEMKDTLSLYIHDFYHKRNLYYKIILKYAQQLKKLKCNLKAIDSIFKEKTISFSVESMIINPRNINIGENPKEDYLLYSALTFFHNYHITYKRLKHYEMLHSALIETNVKVMSRYIKERLAQRAYFSYKYPGVSNRLPGYLGSLRCVWIYYAQPLIDKYASYQKRKELISQGIEPKSYSCPKGAEWFIYLTNHERPFLVWNHYHQKSDAFHFYKFKSVDTGTPEHDMIRETIVSQDFEKLHKHVRGKNVGAFKKIKMLWRCDPQFKAEYKANAQKLTVDKLISYNT